MRRKTEEVLQWFDSNRPQGGDVAVQSGQRGVDTAYLRVSMITAPERWAVVSSPGDRWFALDVDGGFGLIYVEEDTPDEEAAQRLRDYLDIALEYLRQLPPPQRAGLLRVPVVKVRVNGEEVTLRLSLNAFLRRIVRWAGPSNGR